MPFMTKEQIASEAERLGVSLEGLTWPQQQRAIMDAQMEEKDQLLEDEKKLSESYAPRMPWERTKKSVTEYSVEELEQMLAAAKAKEATDDLSHPSSNDKSLFSVPDTDKDIARIASAQIPEAGRDTDGDKPKSGTATSVRIDPKHLDTAVLSEQTITDTDVDEDTTKPDLMAPMRGKRVMIAPEMAQTANQLFGRDEDLGEEVAVEEVHYDIDSAMKFTKDEVSGNYRVIGKTGRRVIAQSAMPKEGAGITFRPDQDIVPIVSWQGRRGYLWTHHRLPNIKDLLKQSGYYEKYKDQFRDEPNIWHAATKLLVCDMGLTDYILAEISRDAKKKLIETAREEDFLTRE